MHLVLVDNLLYERIGSSFRFDLQPHLGLASLAAVVRAAGHRVSIYDPKIDLRKGAISLSDTLHERLARRILSEDPGAVGFTALGCNFNVVALVAKEIRRLKPRLPIILGGPHATILHSEIMNKMSWFDVVARNECEDSIVPLLSALEAADLFQVPGITFRTPNGFVVENPGVPTIKNLDDLPTPAYDCYELKERELEFIRVEAGRGCPFRCTFCSTASFFGRRYRIKSAARLRAEMDYLQEAYGYRSFSLNHDLFTVNRRKVIEFCESVRSRDYQWTCSARIDCVDDRLLEAMRDSGCMGIYYGIEWGSQRLQEKSQKRLDLRLVEPVIEKTTALGIDCITSFLTGHPEEGWEDLACTLDAIGRLYVKRSDLVSAQLHLLAPEPGTQLASAYSRFLDRDEHVSDSVLPPNSESERELIDLYPAIFLSHRHFTPLAGRSVCVFSASFWNELRSLGAIAIRYVVTLFEGRLSLLVRDAYEWHTARSGMSPVFDRRHIVEYLSDRFGKGHPVVSLCRIGTEYTDLQETVDSAPAHTSASCAVDGSAKLVLSPNARLVPQVHDWTILLEHAQSAESGEVDARLNGPKCDLLLIGRSSPARGQVAVAIYEIEEREREVLYAFREPKSFFEFARRMDTASVGEPDWSSIEDLLRVGALVTVQREVELV